ncbi:MAG: FAD-dependent monooxygenase [Burkholderiales bacterium]|nr:FAD-dependent monooxygenase [Burkholderiales bacterium]
MAVRTEATPVLVAGGGPIGLAVAGELGWHGVPCILVEKGDGSITQPKMDLLGIRTMELCRRWGIVEWVEHAGYNRDHPQDYAWVSALCGGYEFGREPSPPPRDEPSPPQSPQHRERQPQNFFDPVLARFARQFPHVSVRYHAELAAFQEHAQGVRARVRDTRTGEESLIEAAYLAGCDGGGSVVREHLGIRLPDDAVLTYTTNAIFRCEDLWSLVDVKPGYRFIFIGPEGNWCTIVAVNGRDQYRFSFVGDANKRALTEPEVRAAIRRAVGRDFAFEVLSIMPWIRREFVAGAYGSARVFLAGDAAHLNSPTGAFGMNTGMQDAVDIGWKLWAVLAGWGGSKLLASYEPERRPVALRNVKEATANLERMMSARGKRLPPGLFDAGPEGERARRTFGENYTEMMKNEWYTLGIHLGYLYEGSPIVVPDGTPRPPEEVMTYTQTARPGSRAPHAWLAPGKSTLDLFGRGFVLLRFAKEVATAPLEAAAAAVGMPLSVADIANAAAARLYERRLALVRPDGHVAWRGDALPADCARLLDTVRGA